ncbi:hypothetical protein DPMN_131601 [Dreissena polymorpha]|uniref:Secreted protein n=1 Tax=Dreissena polymorpha TaxID=45954 RepID=A0A9D4JCD3_DREPO|nr:hypothetical protein DPMN_131601 [Dreissena polymorpha]
MFSIPWVTVVAMVTRVTCAGQLTFLTTVAMPTTEVMTRWTNIHISKTKVCDCLSIVYRTLLPAEPCGPLIHNRKS